MALEKASFYARDPGAKSTDLDDETSKKYMDVERRQAHRRRRPERRSEVRFDLNGGDRRELEGRRDGDITPKFW